MSGASRCTIVGFIRDEAPYLLEWVAWYRLLGTDRLVIYDNASSDAGPALLAALDAAGEIVARTWPDQPGVAPQIPIYEDAVRRCETEWIGFLDIDEFAVLPRDGTLPALLARMPVDCGAVVLNQRVVGTNGHMVYKPGLVNERFPRGSGEELWFNQWVKSIARAKWVHAPAPHHPALTAGRTLMADGAEVAIEEGQRAPRVSHEMAYYNHFVLKSTEEYLRKRLRGCSLTPPDAADRMGKYTDAFFRAHDIAAHEDPRAAAMLPALRAEMARLAAILARAGVAVP